MPITGSLTEENLQQLKIAIAAAEEKKKASLKEEDAPTEIFVAKKPARTALGGLVVTTAESLERELLLIESQLTLKQINEEIRRPFYYAHQ